MYCECDGSITVVFSRVSLMISHHLARK